MYIFHSFFYDIPSSNLIFTFSARNLSIFNIVNCERKTRDPSGICISCQAIHENTRFKDALNEKRHDNTIAKFIPKHYEFTKALQNANLKKFYHASAEQETKIWLELAELGQKACCPKVQEPIQYLKMPLVRQRTKDQDIFTNPDLSFENIMRFAKVANWKGPVILMTDYTKLRPKVAFSQDFGAIMGLVLSFKVSTYEDIHTTVKLIRDNNAVANQIREFILKIPISKIPPVMIAVMPTKGGVKATEISQLLLNIIDMTARARINLLTIDSFYGIKFRAPIYNNRPIIRVQCPKHAKKTARNQVHYGSKLLTFGSDTVRYDQLLEFAQIPNSPICIRDVRNVDKQDDAAAYRTFHSDLISMSGEFKYDKDKLSAIEYVIDIDTQSIDGNITKVAFKL
ncbi:hypothetical protein RclHR1_06370002 [Rhizophagus clarus]|uniref:Uncharacterized protein n=1 Tax=Rhizophagus clarus TaxID=94130 RepID=A0A2Z6S462_9GLOM|nr:hypothetical protein RclHR1_06370002 [Rhizophagus clarus]